MRKQSLIEQRNEYLDNHPKYRKWVNECVCCHRQGYNPNMPEHISVVEGSLECYHIKKYFSPPLTLDADGYCEVCAKFKNK